MEEGATATLQQGPKGEVSLALEKKGSEYSKIPDQTIYYIKLS